MHWHKLKRMTNRASMSYAELITEKACMILLKHCSLMFLLILYFRHWLNGSYKLLFEQVLGYLCHMLFLDSSQRSQIAYLFTFPSAHHKQIFIICFEFLEGLNPLLNAVCPLHLEHCECIIYVELLMLILTVVSEMCILDLIGFHSSLQGRIGKRWWSCWGKWNSDGENLPKGAVWNILWGSVMISWLCDFICACLFLS